MRSARTLAAILCIFVLFLTACGGDKNEKLLTAVEESNLEDIQSLAEKGADLNATDEFSRTPLMIASYNGDIDIVAFLLEKGVDLTATAKYGQTALQFATEQGKSDIVNMLKAAGAQK